ncbi:MAG: radical SAM protein [Sphaerochaetaceae bacterium]|nr:radical SAM protein [Sphaerochaetaceae bacterium]
MKNLELYNECMLCPNYCKVNRNGGKLGVCGESAIVRVAWSGLHKGEEPPVTGKNGSGMIFFSGCPLHCQYCQNYQISGGLNVRDGSVGTEVSIDELARMMIELQKIGANNINFVTGTHFIPSIIEAIDIARSMGMTLPLVWNTSGYESIEGLKAIDEYIDLYLIDLKTLDRNTAKNFCGTERYVDYIKPVFDFIVKKHPKYKYKGQYTTPEGILVRHLIFPGPLKSTTEFLEYYAKNLKDKCFLSLMVQFTDPINPDKFKKISEEDYDNLLTYLDILDIEDGFVQEIGDDVEWIPDFKLDMPFPKNFCTPLEYYLDLKKEN